jgi:hypothetical protein
MKNRIIFLPVPENFKKQYNHTGEAFPIESDIPIPVEIPDDIIEIDSLQKSLTNLNMDMIISAMLRVIEEKQVKQEWINYYSGFVLFMRPDILEICQTHEEKK